MSKLSSAKYIIQQVPYLVSVVDEQLLPESFSWNYIKKALRIPFFVPLSNDSVPQRRICVTAT